MDISSILDQIKYCDKIVKYKFHFKIVGSVEITCTVPLSIRMKVILNITNVKITYLRVFATNSADN